VNGTVTSTSQISILGMYTVINENGSEEDTLVLMSNPAGTDLILKAWFDGDSLNWTPSIIAQVPFYSNNIKDGLFYVSIYDFDAYFTLVEVAYYYDNFVHNYLEVVNDDGTSKAFSINRTVSGKAYIGVEYYNPRMYPSGCHTYTEGYITLLTASGTMISSIWTSDYLGFNYFDFDNL
jgi:hypothetical protein